MWSSNKVYSMLYDYIAHEYDVLFSSYEDLREELGLLAQIEVRGSVLDIGCGTGMLLRHLKPRDYTGLDPSGPMLERLKLKHPEYAHNVIQCRAEEYSGGTFDTILALFGTASYINPNAIKDYNQYNLRRGGRAYWMYYKSGYVPRTHKHLGVSPIVYYAPHPGKPYGNYEVVCYENL